MAEEKIKFEMTRANNCYDSCVRMGLTESADLYQADYVRLQSQLDEITAVVKKCDWSGDADADANLSYAARGKTYECCSGRCLNAVLSDDDIR